MNIVVRDGSWAFTVVTDHESAAFDASGSLSDSEVAVDGGPANPIVRAIVELRALTGGMRPCAMVGGEFEPKPGKAINFHVGHTGALRRGDSATCSSLVGGPPLVSGLPMEFARAALDGLIHA